jgi:lipoyl(octanoyl) transferase
MKYFQYIVPCGLTKPVTSMAELGVRADIEDVKASLAQHFAKIFEFEMQAEPALIGRF